MQLQREEHHPFDHIIIGYRVSNDFHSQSDVESDDDDDDRNDQMNDDDINEDDSQFIDSSGDVSCDESTTNFDRESTKQFANFFDSNLSDSK